MLFDPIKIGDLELKNRICMPAIHHCYTPEGLVNDRLIKYYETRAAGGAALLIVGGCTVDTIGGGPVMIGLHDDRFIEGLSDLTTAVKAAGARIAAQLYQAGRYTHSMISGRQALAPSAIPSRFTRETPGEMTLEDIDMVMESFVAAALRAKQSGFDAVEIIASAGYLICQFLSPVTNQRSDLYGGTWENRCRFGLEVISRVRAKVGPHYPILLRLSGHDFVPGSNTNKEAAAFAVESEKAGVDLINVTGGWHETRVPQITGELPRGGFAYLARGIKEAVHVPVIASNRINDPLTAEQILKDGLADLVNLGRPLIADPDFPNKAKQGRYGTIRRCIACNQGCMDSVFTLQSVFCSVNPLAGRENEIKVTPASEPLLVLVVGGGPAGLEAARMAALRGHQVTLWEKALRLGGQLLYAAIPTGKHEFSTLLDYYKHELTELGVEIVLDKEALAGDIIAFGAGAVILATGAVPSGAPFPVADPAKVVPAQKVLDGSVNPGKRAVVVGGGAVGCETAITIAEMGTLSAETLKFLIENEAEEIDTLRRLLNRGTRQVVIVEQFKGLGRDIGISTRWVVMKNIRRLGIKVIDETKVKAVTTEGLILEKGGAETMLPADTVILAVGARSENTLAEQLKEKVPELYLVGDAVAPRKITEAIREGFEAALKIR
ncbi:MAG: FAD-dependent oxidoreductase [Dethiobacter sp.]|jgi:2,4-dienoyl-CoA reductase (NADPH2)|nr:FAD-dependent oxidoreductase [Dethiobacter sp.]